MIKILDIEKVKNTKSFKTMSERFTKVCTNGDPDEITEFFKKNIIPISFKNFKRKAPHVNYFVKEAYRLDKISKEQYSFLKKLILDKINHKLLDPTIDFKSFFQDYNDLISNIRSDEITKEGTFALLATPILCCSHTVNCLELKYSDLHLKEVSSGLLLTYKDKKKTNNILIVENIEKSYKKLLNMLIEKYGKDSCIFSESPEKSWILRKTGKILYKSYRKYIQNSNEYVEESTFITLLKRILKEQQESYYREF